MRFLAALALLLAPACGGGGPEYPDPNPLPAPLSALFPIDGVVGVVDWAAVGGGTSVTADFRGPGGALVKSTTLRYAFANDDRFLYVALSWTDDTFDHDFDPATGPVLYDGAKLLFDVDGDGTLETSEDERMVIAAGIGSLYIDQHVSAGDETDEVADGYARLRYDAAAMTYTAEFLFPSEPDAAGEDGLLRSTSRFSIALFDAASVSPPGGNLAAPFGTGPGTASWPILPLPIEPPHDHPELPPGLTGRIAFISTHEVANGEIYTFDPASRTTTRVTFLPALWKDNVSLSHDGTRLAFHGSGDPDDFSAYEIYVVNVDGTGLQQLTSNAILDGHPGWSNNDARIVYASFRPDGTSIVVMTDAGVEIADLTPPGGDDNDPDYLPDGRIVFKTTRFSTAPEVRIASIPESGGIVRQLTSVSGTSDHDPAPEGSYVLFERFPRATNYATDPDAAFVGWDIVEARQDGLGERLVLSDGWVNWLPVSSPDHMYIAYLKSSGQTECRLMDRAGKDRGRLIPNITKIRYLDWK